MVSINDAVIGKPQFEKVAKYELQKDVKTWNEDILNQFFEQLTFIPQEIGTDVAIKEVDENSGYAKGSIIAWFNDKKINFPVIIKDYKLSPFDVFVSKKGDNYSYSSANEANIRRALMSDEMGKPENRFEKTQGQLVKSPGGIPPKTSVDLNEVADYNMVSNGVTKMSMLNTIAEKSDKADMDHLKEVLEKNANIANSFVDTTGDLINNVIDLNIGEKVVPDDHKEAKIDTKNIVKAKQAITAIDSEFLDTTKLIPIEAPAVCELRLYEYPSMEDFMDRGASAIQRFAATKVGRPISGIVIDYKEYYDLVHESYHATPDCSPGDEKKEMRNKRPQIFICSEGKYYCIASDYQKTGIAFYGTNLINSGGMLEKVVGRIKRKTENSTDFLKFNQANKGDGSGKLFNMNREKTQGKGDADMDMPMPCSPMFSRGLLCLYGAKDAYECIEFNGSFKKYMVSDAPVFASRECSIIPARVAAIQKVKSVSDPVYKMIVGNCKNIFLVPEQSIFINKSFMERLSDGDIMKPSKSIQKVYEDAAISKVSMMLGKEGYKFEGEPVNPLYKIAGFDSNTEFGTEDATCILSVMGMEKKSSQEAMKVLLNRSMEKNACVNIYGLRDDYINAGAFEEMEKTARIKEIYKELAKDLKRDLIKEASVLEDPEAVDVVLSLNFVNEENLSDYVDNIQTIRTMISKLAGMLVAARMGLTELDEGAVKSAMTNLEDVADGLENIKLAIGK